VKTLESKKKLIVKRKAKGSNPSLSEAPAAAVETSLQRAHRQARESTAATHARFDAEAEAEQEARALKPRPNPLLDLSEEQRSKLFVWLRECPYNDAVQQMLCDQGIPGVTPMELTEFFQSEAEDHWQRRIERAALEANALVGLVEKNPVRFSSGILAALGQEAFRQIASGEVQPDAMTKMANLFLKARGDERAEQVLEMKRQQMHRDWRNSTEHALEVFAEEVNGQPEAKKAFEALRAELLRAAEGDA
jgi:hypothetical protein